MRQTMRVLIRCPIPQQTTPQSVQHYMIRNATHQRPSHHHIIIARPVRPSSLRARSPLACVPRPYTHTHTYTARSVVGVAVRERVEQMAGGLVCALRRRQRQRRQQRRVCIQSPLVVRSRTNKYSSTQYVKSVYVCACTCDDAVCICRASAAQQQNQHSSSINNIIIENNNNIKLLAVQRGHGGGGSECVCVFVCTYTEPERAENLGFAGCGIHTVYHIYGICLWV